MNIEPLQLIIKRMNISKQEGDSIYFNELLLYGEFLIKLISIQLVSCIVNDKERTKYKYEHQLVRGNAIGVYASTIEEVIVNYRDKLIRDFTHNEAKELTIKTSEGTWQYESIKLLKNLCLELNIKTQDLPLKLSLYRWFSDFTVLRNKSKGHGALPPSKQAKNVFLLEKSINLIVENYYGLNNRQWVYLYQNLSGKYRISQITQNSTLFDYLKYSTDFQSKFKNGCYCYVESPIKLGLLKSTPELDDFYLPNGNYKKSSYEMLSYISGNMDLVQDIEYNLPVSQLPKSHTEGIGILDAQGEFFGNLPPKPEIYVNREKIEEELNLQLKNQYLSPIITLLGKGGIGKTTTALNCLHELSKQEIFELVIWFSSRDIDLLQDGPKVVKANVFSIQDIADEYCRLLEKEIKSKTERLNHFQIALQSVSELGKTLFVFDNFETIEDPLEVYNWLYQYIRPPNKILITSRESRDFKGDYPIEIGKMGFEECKELIRVYATRMGILHILNDEYIEKLINESDGHPYIIKILLGEVMKTGRVQSIERIVADRDDILTALFRRTFTTLSRPATRVFLTLCSWRSAIPQIAIEAVLLRPENEERVDVSDAIEELRKCSFIDIIKSNKDDSDFVAVPLAASVFGKEELNIYPEKLAILEDRKLLLQFGVTQGTDVKNGLLPKIERKFKAVSSEIDKIRYNRNYNQEKKSKKIHDVLQKSLPVIEYLCTKVPEGYLYLSDLYSELNMEEEQISALKRFIQSSNSDTEKRDAWRKLVSINRRNDDWKSESHALSEITLIPGTSVTEISNIADRVIKKIMSQDDTDFEHKQLLFDKLIQVFEAKIGSSSNSTDYSRLAWLNIHIKRSEKALKYAHKGIEINPHCGFCNRIVQKLEN